MSERYTHNMMPEEHGEWVTYKDHKAEIDRLKAELAEARMHPYTGGIELAVKAERARCVEMIEALPVTFVNEAASPDAPPRYARFIQLAVTINAIKEEPCPAPVDNPESLIKGVLPKEMGQDIVDNRKAIADLTKRLEQHTHEYEFNGSGAITTRQTRAAP